MPFEESACVVHARIVEGAGDGKDRLQRFETDAETAALVGLLDGIIGRAAKRSESCGLIVPVPARTIGKATGRKILAKSFIAASV